MRQALARAIYSRNRILILDDPLASLDANSEHMISKTLLGPGGYFKSAKATVILTTSVGTQNPEIFWFLVQAVNYIVNL